MRIKQIYNIENNLYSRHSLCVTHQVAVDEPSHSRRWVTVIGETGQVERVAHGVVRPHARHLHWLARQHCSRSVWSVWVTYQSGIGRVSVGYRSSIGCVQVSLISLKSGN